MPDGPFALAERLRAGELSARELIEETLAGIDRRDRALHAFTVVLHERALAEADDADCRRAAGEDAPLLGVPLAVKDDTDVAGVPTSWGTSAFGRPAAADAEIVRRLRAAGAIVVGKTAVPELTQHGFTESPTFGATRNPWSLDHTPGGSSGGSGAALAGGLVPLATGTDGLGSIRIPAAYCGIFGLKPQRGRVSTAPVSDRWFGLLTIGPMARSVLDTARAYDLVLDEPPPRSFADAAASPPPRLRIASSTKVPLGAIPRPLDPDCRRVLDETAELLRSLGHDVRERDPDYGTALVDGIGRYFRGIHEDAAGAERPEKLSARTRRSALIGGLIPRRLIERRRAHEPEAIARVLALWDDFDVLMTPAQTTPPFAVGRYDGRGPLFTLTENATRVPYQAVFNLTGQPAATVPAGLSAGGLPLGIQLVGRPHDEATLLSLAAQLEAERPWPTLP